MLSKRPFNSATTQPKFQALSAAIAAGELQGNALTKLALQTLGGWLMRVGEGGGRLLAGWAGVRVWQQ